VSMRARAILVLTVTALALGMAYPTYQGEGEGLHLGLDLQGGIHWLLGVDQAQAIEAELGRVRENLAELGESALGLTNEEIKEQIQLQPDQLVVSGVPEASLNDLLAEEFVGLSPTAIGDTTVLTLSSSRVEQVLRDATAQAIEVLQRRAAGVVREPIIASEGIGRILVQMPGEVDPERARTIISGQTFLEFKKVLGNAPNEEILLAQYPDGTPSDTSVGESREEGLVTEALLLQEPAVLTGASLDDARFNLDSRTGQAVVGFTWKPDAARIFAEFTSQYIGRRMAIILDGEVLTAPTIESRIARRGQISGSFTPETASALAVNLRSGALPVPLNIEEERTVGPALGRDSIENGFNSILIGGALVIVFMAIYYSLSGVVANAALLLNIVLIIGLMSLAGATLTLPGIAGLVLTVGMAVDANVIIFERIREELRSGKGMHNAVQIGFNRSRLTILDANITTAIAAIILYYAGRGPVQGFGVTLGIGIFSSVFCALVVTRLLVEFMSQRSEKLRI